MLFSVSVPEDSPERCREQSMRCILLKRKEHLSIGTSVDTYQNQAVYYNVYHKQRR